MHVNSFPIHAPKFSHWIHYWAFKYVTWYSEVLTTQVSGDFSASCNYSESLNKIIQCSFHFKSVERWLLHFIATGLDCSYLVFGNHIWHSQPGTCMVIMWVSLIVTWKLQCHIIKKKKKRITELLLLYLYPLFHLSYDLLENPECLSSYRPLKMNLSEKFSSPSQIQEFLHLSVINTCKIQNPSFLGWACCDS